MTSNPPPRQSSIRSLVQPSAGLKALAVDYDGTLAEHGRMSTATETALRSLHGIGFRLILVSGRRLDNIRQVCGGLDLFDAAILENGAVFFCPATGAEQLIAPPADERFLADMARELPDEPVFIGRSMVATAAENAGCVEVLIALGGYDLDVVGCGRRILILPTGVSKSSGLSHALACLGLHRGQVVAVGDEENDIELFKGCALTAAVGNAAPKLKAIANLVLPGESGQSVQWLADMLLAAVARGDDPPVLIAGHQPPKSDTGR